MIRLNPYSVVYAPDVYDHLEAIESKYHSLIRPTIEEQLFFEPSVETRNRKPLAEPNSLNAEWELRFGPENRFRVFYNVDEEQREVRILAIGVTRGNRLMIGEEIEL